MLVHSMDVQKIPDTPNRDSSGGIVDDPSQWTTLYAAVPCARNPASARRMADFAVAGQSITDVVVTFQAGLEAGMRLRFADGDGSGAVYLRVNTVKYVPARGTIAAFFELACEEVRMA